MSNESQVGWLGIYKIYLIVATVLCVVAPVMFSFRAGLSDLTTLATQAIRIFVFAAAVSTVSRLHEPSIRDLHVGLNAAGAAFSLLYVIWGVISAVPFITDIVRILGPMVTVPWSVLVPFSMYQLYPVMSVVGLIAASIWAFLLATNRPSGQPTTFDHSVNQQPPDHSVNQQPPEHNIQASGPRKPWRPLLISFLFALAINLVPFAVMEFDNEKYGWLLFFITVPVGGVVLVIGLIWSIVLVSNRH